MSSIKLVSKHAKYFLKGLLIIVLVITAVVWWPFYGVWELGKMWSEGTLD